MITCPQCHTSNPPSARFCMNCGSFLPLVSDSAANSYPPASPPPSTQGFIPPSEAAQQTGLPPQELGRSGYLRYTRPAGQLDATPVQGYALPTTPPPTAPQSQAAMWMTQGAQPDYYYPPPPTLEPVTTQQGSFGLYLIALIIALATVGAAVWFLLWGMPPAAGGSAKSGGSLAPTPTAPGNAPLGGNALNPTACSAPKPTPQDADQQAIIAAINGSNQDQIDSLKTLKTDVLKNHTTGQELSKHIQDVQDLQSKGFYYEAKLECIDVTEVKINSATDATAQTVESWSGTLYDKNTNRKLATQAAMTMHETYHFVKQNGQWLVSKVDIVEEQNPPPTPDNTQ